MLVISKGQSAKKERFTHKLLFFLRPIQNSHSLLCNFKGVFIKFKVSHLWVTFQSRNSNEGGYLGKRCLLNKLLIRFHSQCASSHILASDLPIYAANLSEFPRKCLTVVIITIHLKFRWIVSSS